MTTIKNIKIKDLKPAEYNPRQMSDDEMEKLKTSIKEFGMVEPIVVNKDLTIIGGHQRVTAAGMLGLDEVPCILLDLDKQKEKLLNLALNKIVGNWDEEKLVKLVNEISEFPDIELSGMSEAELEMLAVQYDLIYDGDEDIKSDENLKKLFARNEKVEIPVEKPEVMIKKNKIAFYVETFEQYEKVRETFKTGRQSELDIEKLLKIMENGEL